jgi:hypothetical protein
MNFLGLHVHPRSFCDRCCRANLWRPSSLEALERLAHGVPDAERVALLEEQTRSWVPAYEAALAAARPSSNGTASGDIDWTPIA